jgi:hypothetical protein
VIVPWFHYQAIVLQSIQFHEVLKVLLENATCASLVAPLSVSFEAPCTGYGSKACCLRECQFCLHSYLGAHPEKPSLDGQPASC